MNTTLESIRAFAELRKRANNLNGTDWFQWMLDNGREFTITDKTFDGPHMEKGQCYRNATHLALNNPRVYTYCEGKVSVYGVPIDHAWLCDANGNVIDPTLTKDPEGRITDYWGVPFAPGYLKRSILKNGVYGLLDGFYARKTIRPLMEGKVKRFRRKIREAA